MEILTIINLFMLPSLIATLILGAAINYKLIEANKYQRALIATFVYWALIMLYVYIKFFIDVNINNRVTISYTADVCGMQVILLGIFCFVSLISYPAVVLEAKYLEFKSWWKRIKPTVISVVAYFAVNIIAGTNPFTKYATMDEFISNISSVTVISRLCLTSALAYIWGSEIRRIWRLVPCYNQYIQENCADSQCNVDWVRKLIIYISIVTCAYLGMLFFGSPLMNLIYISTVTIMFVYMVRMSLIYRTSEGLEQINIIRNPTNAKEYIIVPIDESDAASIPITEIKRQIDNTKTEQTPEQNLEQIDSWMEKESPYTSIHFSTNDILDAFPQFTREDLTMLFRNQNETFQSYVRRFRIKKACEIMSSKDKRAYSQKIYAIVGFSHYSSFSRSFVSMVDISPSQFIKLSDQEKTTYTEKL